MIVFELSRKNQKLKIKVSDDSDLKHQQASTLLMRKIVEIRSDKTSVKLTLDDGRVLIFDAHTNGSIYTTVVNDPVFFDENF